MDHIEYKIPEGWNARGTDSEAPHEWDSCVMGVIPESVHVPLLGVSAELEETVTVLNAPSDFLKATDTLLAMQYNVISEGYSRKNASVYPYGLLQGIDVLTGLSQHYRWLQAVGTLSPICTEICSRVTEKGHFSRSQWLKLTTSPEPFETPAREHHWHSPSSSDVSAIGRVSSGSVTFQILTRQTHEVIMGSCDVRRRQKNRISTITYVCTVCEKRHRTLNAALACMDARKLLGGLGV